MPFFAKIIQKTNLPYFLLPMLILVLGGSSYFYTSHLTDQVTKIGVYNWNAADGVMELVIEIERQIIKVDEAIAGMEDPAAIKQILETSDHRVEHLFERIQVTGIVSAGEMDLLRNNLKRFRAVRQTVMDYYLSGIETEAVSIMLQRHHAEVDALLAYLKSMETVADAQVVNRVQSVVDKRGGHNLITFAITLVCVALVVLVYHLSFRELRSANMALAEALRKSEQAATAKSEFLANMSHEIRTPMNGVLGMLSLLETTKVDSTQSEYLSIARNSGELLISLINDILDLSKIDSDNYSLSVTRFGLVNFLREVIDVVLEPCLRNGNELICELGPGLPSEIEVDPMRLKQVMVNILGNAGKFTLNGNIILRLTLDHQNRSDGCWLRCEIQDSGIGIRDADKDRIFEVFCQSDGTITRKFGGTGLGLAIARKLVGKMGGNIGVDSIPDVGSHFWFTFPVGNTGPGTAVQKQEVFAGARALIVDANGASANAVRSLLLEAGFARVDVSIFGPQRGVLGALNNIVKLDRDYDVVFMDISRLGKSESEFDDIMDTYVRRVPLRYVLAGSLGDKQDFFADSQYGHVRMVSKPYTWDRLENLLPELLQNELPVIAEDTRQAELSVSGNLLPAATSHECALVVEDNITNRMVIVAILKQLGLACDVADNGLQAVEMCGKKEYSVVLMDCNMPVMDGYDATRRIRAMESGGNHHARIIAVTANVMPEDRDICYAAGMDDYIKKPILVNEFREKIEQWLHTPGPEKSTTFRNMKSA